MTFRNDNEEEVYDGAVVGLCVRPNVNDDPFNARKNHLWTFTSDGYIQSTGIVAMVIIKCIISCFFVFCLLGSYIDLQLIW